MLTFSWPFHLSVYSRERDSKMPRGKSTSGAVGQGGKGGKQPRRAKSDDEWAGFVPCELSDDGREAWEVWNSGSVGNLSRSVDDVLATGLKLTMTYDGANQCYVASFSGRPDSAGGVAFNGILTGRAGTFEDALSVLVYKHVELLRGEWWDVLNRPKVNKQSFG